MSEPILLLGNFNDIQYLGQSISDGRLELDWYWEDERRWAQIAVFCSQLSKLVHH
ncbi:hypothetical protein DPMN_015644 [Dreissena polymorpha]|uniref:Uncharacterized protein n=1 Tax=Dreissena polymorpha TaxID=45954 RepID=A0A9D4S5N1_DREPO|nr:hypothetical protein DPMN_015644 [Dreissena polymorpha]